ncbi:MAG: hypothetical protein ACYTEQ_06530 [Planctomycetota bacterium]|jgi:hypothetical protein
MKIFRWESADHVVEIAAPNLKAARLKAAGSLDADQCALTLTHPGDVRNCRMAVYVEDCVKAWTKN